MSTIIRLTFLEMKEKKILHITIVLTAVFIALYGVAAKYAYAGLANQDAAVKLAFLSQFISIGVYVGGFIIAFLSVFSSAGAISSDIENGTYDAILSKPIARYEIVLGKFIGLLSILIPYVTIMYLGIIGVNVFLGKGEVVNFTLVAIIKSLLIMYILPILLTSIGIFLSCRTSTVGSGIILVILYFLGMIGGFLEKMSFVLTDQVAKLVMSNIGIITSLAIPSDIVYRKASSVLFTTKSGLNFNIESMIGGNVQPSSFMMFYIVLYIIVMIVLAIQKFQKRDL